MDIVSLQQEQRTYTIVGGIQGREGRQEKGEIVMLAASQFYVWKLWEKMTLYPRDYHTSQALLNGVVHNMDDVIYLSDIGHYISICPVPMS